LKERASDRASAIVTLVDDIFDCHRHLFAAGGRFDPPKDVDSGVLDLLSILDWRSKETILADWMAAACARAHYVFAVKHPMATFVDLLYSQKPKLYFSHPISEPRRLLREAPHNEEAMDIVRHSQNVISRLNSRFVVIEPTAIDEYRFRTNSDDAVFGNLDSRWPFTRDGRELLYSPPDNPGNPRAFPVGWDVDTRGEIPPSPLVDALHRAILSQIDARDHALVEHSDRMACFRPIYQGNVSRGVKEELQHLARLIALGVRPAVNSAVVYCPRCDRDHHPSCQLSSAVTGWRRSGLVTGNPEQFLALLRQIEGGDPMTIAVCRGDSNALMALCQTHGLAITPDPSPDEVPTSALGVTAQVLRDAHAAKLAAGVLRQQSIYLDQLHGNGIIDLTNDEEQFFASLGC
jgi:hypothetical protein